MEKTYTREEILGKFSSERFLKATFQQLEGEGVNVEQFIRDVARDRLGLVFPEEMFPLGEFWEIVEEIDWPNNTDTNPDIIKKGLLKRFSPKELVKFRERLDHVRGELIRALEDWERRCDKRLECSDDGFSDLTYHIVGCGKEEFAKTIKDPYRAYDRSRKFDYVESFGYCIPYEDEHKYLGIAHYQKYARRLLDSYDAKIFEDFIETGNLKPLLEKKEGLLKEFGPRAYGIESFFSDVEAFLLDEDGNIEISEEAVSAGEVRA